MSLCSLYINKQGRSQGGAKGASIFDKRVF